MNLRLAIDRLVLDGVDLRPDDAPRFRAALAAELARLFEETAGSGRPLDPAALAELRAADITVAPGGDVRRLARDVARSLVDSLGPAPDAPPRSPGDRP